MNGRGILARPPLRRACAALSLAGFLAAIVGAPVLSPCFGPDGKDLSRPFPCMHSHCGCATAEQCWRGCCCHTNREKLAWAKAHDVAPPEYVLAAADKEPVTVIEPSDLCCKPAVVAHSCCQSDKAGRDPASIADEPVIARADARPSQWHWLPAVAARKCHGMPQIWMLLSSVSPTVPEFEWRPTPIQFGRVLLCCDLSVSLHLPPATPPPRA